MPNTTAPHICGPEYDSIVGMHGYHLSARVVDPSSNEHPFKIGFEIEKEDDAIRQSIRDNNCTLPGGWICENDGSLGYGGYELVTRAYNLSWWDQLVSDIGHADKAIGADGSSACGGHIHISDSRFTPLQLADRLRPLFPLLMTLYPNRMRSTYVRCSKMKQVKEDSGNKYQPFYIKDPRTNGKTIELRIFSAVKDATQLMWRARLLKLVLEASYEKGLSFAWMSKAIAKGGSIYTLLLEVYTEDQIRSKVATFWSMASFFLTDRPVHAVIAPILNRIPESYLPR